MMKSFGGRLVDSLPVQLWAYLTARKKWWLFPIIVIFVGFGALLTLTSTAAAPLVYALF